MRLIEARSVNIYMNLNINIYIFKITFIIGIIEKNKTK